MPDKNSRGLALHWKILIGLAAGLLVGLLINATKGSILEAVGEDGPDRAAVNFLVDLNTFVGDLFIRCLRFIAVPIVLFSLIVGTSSISDLKKLSRVGFKTIAIYLSTTAVAITVGLIGANLVRPGSFVGEEVRDRLSAEKSAEAAERIEQAAAPDVWDTVLNLIPVNPFRALAEGNMLQVVVTALIVGIILTLLPKPKSGPVVAFFDTLTDVVIAFVHGIMKLAPYAVFALLVGVVSTMGLEVLKALIVYSAVVIAGLGVMMFGLYPLVLKLFAGVGYRRFFSAIAPAQLLAFSSSSSSATLPVTMECVEERLGVSEEVTSFVVPVGATINMDGTALYQGVAAVFIAQMFGIDLTLGQQLTIVLTATLASIGTAGVPGVGMIMLVIVLQSLKMPAEVMTAGVAVIFGVDRLLDMCRTSCNVTGDCMVAAVVAASEGELHDPAERTDLARDTEAITEASASDA